MKSRIKEVFVLGKAIGFNKQLKAEVEAYLSKLNKVKIDVSNFYFKKTGEIANVIGSKDSVFNTNFKKYGESVSTYLYNSIKKYIDEIYKFGVGLAAFNEYSISELVDALVDVYVAAIDSISYNFSKKNDEEGEEENIENVQEVSRINKAKSLLTAYAEDFKKNIKDFNENLINTINVEDNDKIIELLDKYLKEVLNRNFYIEISVSNKEEVDNVFNIDNLKKFQEELYKYEDFKTKYSRVDINKFQNFDLLSNLSNKKVTDITQRLNSFFKLDLDSANFYNRFLLWVKKDDRWKKSWEKKVVNQVKERYMKNLKEEDNYKNIETKDQYSDLNSNNSNILNKISDVYLSTKNENLIDYGKNISLFLIENKESFLKIIYKYIVDNKKTISLGKVFKEYIKLLQLSLDKDISTLREEEVNSELKKIYYDNIYNFINKIDQFNEQLLSKIGEEEYDKIKLDLNNYLLKSLNLLGNVNYTEPDVQPQQQGGNTDSLQQDKKAFKKIGKESLLQFLDIYNKTNVHSYNLKEYFGSIFNIINKDSFNNIKSRAQILGFVKVDFPDLYKVIPNYVYYFLWSYLLWTRDDENWKNIRLSELKNNNLNNIISNIIREEKSKKDKKLFALNRTFGYLLSVAESPKSLYKEISQIEPLLNKKVILSLVRALVKIRKIKDGKSDNTPS